jgi:hypothetical protein
VELAYSPFYWAGSSLANVKMQDHATTHRFFILETVRLVE